MEKRLLQDEKEYLNKMIRIANKKGVCLKIIEDDERGRIFIVAKDWPGLQDAISTAIHERGFNLKFFMGFVLEKDLAGIIAEVDIRDKKIRERFNKEKEFLKHYLPDIAKFDPWMKSLIDSTASKLRIFREVLRILRKEVKKKKLIKEMVLETEKFFSSRSWAYIGDRKPQDLAQQILMQIELRNLVKEKGGIHVHIKNFRTVSEELTGIFIAGPARELFLDQVLDVLRDIIPDFRRKFEKVFTEEGVTVIRLEIQTPEETWYPEEKHLLIENYLIEHLKLRRRKILSERMRISPEIIGRIIIPSLIQEARNTKIPQIYISLTGITEENYYFKIMGVVPRKEEGSYTDDIIKFLDKEEGIRVLSSKAPTFSHEFEIIIINICSETIIYDTPEDVYKRLNEILRELIGSFRDFDQGLRNIEQTKFNQLEEKMAGSGIESHLLRRLFYSLDEFFRVQAEIDDLFVGFKIFWDNINKYISKHEFICNLKNAKKTSIITFCGEHSEKIFEKILDEFRGKEISALRFDDLGFIAYLIFLSYNQKPLEYEEIYKKLKKICENLLIKVQIPEKV
ncbi:MAG: hypothetical protein ABIM58_02800 [candidate division WOR-3 bacterium]